MKRAIFAALLGLAAAPVTAEPQVPQGAEAARLRAAGAEVLFWNQAQRDANFSAMETLFPGSVAAPAARPHPLPAGRALALPTADAFMAANNTAGLIVVQDGKIRFER
jgi:hypothetical protein